MLNIKSFFTLILVVGICFSCSKEKKSTVRQPIQVVDPCTCGTNTSTVSEADSYILGVIHNISNVEKQVGYLYNDPCGLSAVIDRIIQLKGSVPKISTEGIIGEKVDQNNGDPFVPICILKKHAIPYIYSIDSSLSVFDGEDHVKVFRHFSQLRIDHLSMVDTTIRLKKPFSKSEKMWLRDEWYPKIALHNIKFEKKIIEQAESGGIVVCGIGHARNLYLGHKQPMNTNLYFIGPDTEAQNRYVDTLFYVQRYICQQVIKLPYQ